MRRYVAGGCQCCGCTSSLLEVQRGVHGGEQFVGRSHERLLRRCRVRGVHGAVDQQSALVADVGAELEGACVGVGAGHDHAAQAVIEGRARSGSVLGMFVQ